MMLLYVSAFDGDWPLIIWKYCHQIHFVGTFQIRENHDEQPAAIINTTNKRNNTGGATAPQKLLGG